MVCVYFLLISATAAKVKYTAAAEDNTAIVQSPLSANTFKTSKLNFFQRTLMKFALKKFKKADTNKGDKQAGISLAFGIAACGFLLIGVIVPYVILAALPAGIVAMITGGSAIRNGTNREGKARTGKALGLGALIAFGALLLAVVLIIAAWNRG